VGGSGGTGVRGSGGTGGVPGSGGQSGTGGSSGTILPGGAFAVELYASDALWGGLLERTIAVDSSGVVYVTDGDQVYSIENGIPSVYISEAEFPATPYTGSISYLDVGPDDRLYILRLLDILVSSAPGEASVHFDELRGGRNFLPHQIGVESADRILLVTLYDGLFAVTADDVTEVHPDDTFHGGNNCGSEDFQVDGTHFYYLPGCNSSIGHTVFSGPLDGSPMGALIEGAKVEEALDNPDVPSIISWTPSGMSPHPEGGLVVNFEASLVRVFSDGSFRRIRGAPELYDLSEENFFNGVVAVGPDGDIYVISRRRVIYRARPPQTP
jgi:hypothetical protein